ncbi:hypothetical protein DTO166G4_8025 [Paecilomyces variotii]|nr:hypothetical protein DTO164E3_8191 [Paecilomyces variotii]KAJ9195841.1 hypothetical protein DTO032I3_6676 [Paecilomyces variotii]KAJ9210377.1 hypothetical protein DTO166G4_8025 [Paecilomyces variotii]KAJ9219537.1 hypothetical protein DTO169C6_8078 [Paecilomyces variotii]KAJ9228405.1 hypothetical protein DTO166G5_8621 [Paecilomyces variotii]
MIVCGHPALKFSIFLQLGSKSTDPRVYKISSVETKSHSKLRDASAHGDTVSLTGQPLSVWYIRFVTEHDKRDCTATRDRPAHSHNGGTSR